MAISGRKGEKRYWVANPHVGDVVILGFDDFVEFLSGQMGNGIGVKAPDGKGSIYLRFGISKISDYVR